jgi:hypothetical protein
MTPTIPVISLELCEGCKIRTNLEQMAPGTCLNAAWMHWIADLLCEECKKQLK